MALDRLKVGHVHLWSCDINPAVKKTLLYNFPHMQQWHDDLMSRDQHALPDLDLYIAGFPCQSFSLAGTRKGLKDKRGQVFFGCRDTIDAKRPRAFVLENVKGLMSHDGGATLARVMKELKEIGGGAYEVECMPLSTQDHGVPQSRPRVYIVGILKSAQSAQHKFQWPKALPKPSIEEFLDPIKGTVKLTDLPPKTSGTAYRNVTAKLKQLKKEGIDPLNASYIIDCDSSDYRSSMMRDRCMTITRSRAQGFWVTSRARRLTLDEMFRLQGMTPGRIVPPPGVSERQVAQMIGNAMSQNVLERLFSSLLPAAGLVSRTLQDPWLVGNKRVLDSVRSEPQPAAKRARTAS